MSTMILSKKIDFFQWSFAIYVCLSLFPFAHVQVDIRVSPGSHADEQLNDKERLGSW